MERHEQQLIAQQRLRTDAYRRLLEREESGSARRQLGLRNQGRSAQFRYQELYLDGLRQQRLALHAAGFDYARDPYFRTAPTFVYSYGGRSRRVNHLGAGALRAAVSAGYRRGFGTGEADREDHWQSAPRSSYAYSNALYGFDGMYLDPVDYAYYFRQGFDRGYEDGFYRRARYGVYANGGIQIPSSLLDHILDLRPL